MMRPLPPVLALFVWCCVPGPAAALTLEQSVHACWDASPQLEAQRTLADEAAADRWRRFLPNEPQGSLGASDDGSSVTYGLSLTLAFPGKALLIWGSDRAQARAQEAEWKARRFDLARSTLQLYADAAGAQAQARLAQEAAADLEALAAALKLGYEQGHSAQAEKIGAELQLSQARADLRAAQDHAAVSRGRLAAWLGRAEEDLGGLELPDDLGDTLAAELGDRSSDELRAAAAAEVAEANRFLAYWNQLPDLTLSAQRNHYVDLAASPSGQPWTSNYSIGLTLPLMAPLREAAEGARARAQAALDLDAARLQRLQAEGDREDARREAERSRDRLKELRERDLVLAQALVDSTAEAYRLGKLGYAELMASHQTLAGLKAQDVTLRQAILADRLRSLAPTAAAPAIQQEARP